MITRWTSRLRRLRRWFSRSEWDVRLLGLPRSQGTESSPGMLLIQIDGLARTQLERALKRGRMPYLRRLIQREGYRLHDFYSGLPATTPAVQGELFYGQKCAVPAFAFRDHSTGKMVRMLESEPALRVEARLQKSGNAGLLEGGSAYCDIYSGGATENHFCAVTGGIQKKPRETRLLARLWLFLWHSASAVRVVALMLVELVLAVIDMMRGIVRRREWFAELKFIASRVLVSIGLRELSTIGAMMDLARGLPIVHVNFLGYDEQSHRRGPSSLFAHWALRGIDRAIEQLASAARRSACRDYDVWVYSDHGQDHTRSYLTEYGKSIEEGVAAVLRNEEFQKHVDSAPDKKYKSARSLWLGSWFSKFADRPKPESKEEAGRPNNDDLFSIIALGPIGHLYLKQQPSDSQYEEWSRKLVKLAGVPLVLRRDQNHTVRAFTPAGEFSLPSQAREVLGAEHPFLNEAAQDLVELCWHDDAGDLVLGGFRTNDRSLTFPLETGSHAGPGYHETHAFALLPSDAPLPPSERDYLRPLELRQAALHQLGRESLKIRQRKRRSPQPETIRIMTYNVHGCIGMDGKHSPARIARVIEQCEADVIALQELDVGRARTGDIDQAHTIARLIDMEHYFHPALRIEEELYGDAILSYLPTRLIHCGVLPGLAARPRLEPRGALWVEVALGNYHIQILNTHLGLSREEQLAQVAELQGKRWLENPDCQGPVILCGDFNAGPSSKPYRQLVRSLSDAQHKISGHRPRATWLSHAPFNRIDHIFISPHLRVHKIEVPRTKLTRVASDHLPLIIEVSIEPEWKPKSARHDADEIRNRATPRLEVS